MSAPLGQILELQEDGIEGPVVVPQWKAPVHSLRLFRDKLLVSYLLDLEVIVHVWSLGG